MIASGPEDRARLAHRHVVLADVDAVGVAGSGQVGVVVDDEEGAVGVAEAAEGARRRLDLAPRQRLLAQLDDVDAAAQRRPQQRLGVLAVRQRVADEVEARRAQPLAAQRAGGLGWCQAHRPIMRSSRRRAACGVIPRPGVASEGSTGARSRGLRGRHEATDRLDLIRVMPAEANGLSREAQFRRDLRWRRGDRPLLRLARGPARRPGRGARARRAAGRRDPRRRRDAGAGRRARPSASPSCCEMTLAAAELYPDFVAELEAASGIATGYAQQRRPARRPRPRRGGGAAPRPRPAALARPRAPSGCRRAAAASSSRA